MRERRDKAAERLESFFPPPEGVLPLEGLGPRLNLNSPKQITDAFETLGIELPDTKVWTLLKVDHPAAKALLRLQGAAEETRHLPGNLPRFHKPEDRPHPRQLPAVPRPDRKVGLHRRGNARGDRKGSVRELRGGAYREYQGR